MGNCASFPKTKEGKAPEPKPEPVAAEEVKVEQQENNVEAKTDDTTVVPSQDNSLANLLNEKKEEGKKEEQVEAKEEVKAEAKNEEKLQTEEPKPEITKEEKPQA